MNFKVEQSENHYEKRKIYNINMFTCFFVNHSDSMWQESQRSISRIAVACVYIPPSVNIEMVNSFCDYFCYCYDKLKSESPSTAIIAAGDFNSDSNGLNIRTITRQCHIKQIVKTPTRGNAFVGPYFYGHT